MVFRQFSKAVPFLVAAMMLAALYASMHGAPEGALGYVEPVALLDRMP